MRVLWASSRIPKRSRCRWDSYGTPKGFVNVHKTGPSDIVAGYLMANIDPETQPRRRVAPCFQSKFDFRTVFVRFGFGFGLFRDFADALPRSKGQLLKVRSREERQTERKKER